MQDVSSKSIYYSVIISPCKDRRHVATRCAPCFGSNLRNVFKMTDFCIFIEFHKISKVFDFVSIISIRQIMLLLYLVSILYLFKISIFYMKINLTTAIHCSVLFHGGSCLTEALVYHHSHVSFIVELRRKISNFPENLSYNFAGNCGGFAENFMGFTKNFTLNFLNAVFINLKCFQYFTCTKPPKLSLLTKCKNL